MEKFYAVMACNEEGILVVRLLRLEIEAWVSGSWCLVKGSEATLEGCGRVTCIVIDSGESGDWLLIR